MGKSSSSCLNLITCGGAANQSENEDNEAPAESKASSDKRRWSFQKRTSGHRVLSNSVVSETQTLVPEKEYLENTQKIIEPWAASPVHRNLHNEERPEEAVSLKSELVNSGVYSAPPTEENTPAADDLHDSVVLIQVYIRGYLAQKELAWHKNVVRLQAAIRGHLVRRQAIGTLRCVQAIVKMQALVRLHRGRQLVGNGKSSFIFEKTPSVRVVLSNGFAHQLLTSSTKTKPINIKCDPVSSDSAWKWLERWMAVTSSDLVYQHAKNHNRESRVLGENSSLVDTRLEAVLSITSSSSKHYAVEENSEENSVPNSSGGFQFGSSEFASQNPSPIFDEQESGFEGKQFISSGSKKTCNPAFIAAQAKFEELSSSQAPGKVIKGSSVDPLEAHLAQTTKDGSLIENSNSNYSRGRMAASECGTEISISSTLDSPDRSETEGGEIVLEIIGFEKEKFDGPSLDDETSNQLDISSAEKDFALLNLDIICPQKQEEFDDFHDSVQINEQESKTAVTIMLTHLEKPLDPHGYKSSPEGSPRSRVTIQESHGTPSSQVSTNAAGSKKVGSLSIRNHRSYTTGKRSPSISNSDSAMRNNTEQLSKDSRSSKRRSSFSLMNTEPVDHEPRLSSSSNSVPSYMQITESARAKLLAASVSSKSTPDSNEKDQTKKRHSLPIVNGKQETSPRMQRSTSQVQQNPKAHGNDYPVTSSRSGTRRYLTQPSQDFAEQYPSNEVDVVLQDIVVLVQGRRWQR